MSAKLKKQALKMLSEQPLTLKELALRMDLKEKRAFNVLKSLFEGGEVKCFKDEENQRRYRATSAAL